MLQNFARVMLALMLLAATAVQASARPSGAYAIPLKAEVGDRFTMTVDRQRVTLRNGERVATPTVTSVFDGEYLGRLKEGGFRLRWTLRETRVSDEAGKPTATELAGIFTGSAFEMETDASGMPVKMLDREATLQQISDRLLKAGKADERTLGVIRQIFTGLDERTAALTLFKEQVAVALFQNATLAVGETRQVPALAPNPLGGPAIDMQQSLTLVQVNNNAKTAKFRFTSRLDPASLAASMKVTMAKLTAAISDPARKAEMQQKLAGKLQVDKVTTANAEVSTVDGWLRQLSMSEEISLNSGGDTGSRIETTRIAVEHVR